MKNKQVSLTHKTGNQVVERKLLATNSYLKTIDMNKLHETVQQVQEKKCK